VGDRAQQPLIIAERLRSERGRVLGVTAELGEKAAMQHDLRGDIRQHAGGLSPASSDDHAADRSPRRT
jgi:hypothetical protein